MAAFAAPIIGAGISALAGIFGNKPQKTTTNYNNTSTGTQTGQTQQQNASATSPVYDPTNQAFRDQLIQGYLQSLQTPANMKGYETQGIGQINANANARTQAVNSLLAARGLSYSPVAALAPAASESQRISDIGNFQNNIPLQQWQMMQQALNNAGSYQSRLPVGTTSSSSSSGTTDATTTQNNQGTSTTTGPNNQVAGGLAGAGSALAYLYGSGGFGGGGVNPGTNTSQAGFAIPDMYNSNPGWTPSAPNVLNAGVNSSEWAY